MSSVVGKQKSKHIHDELELELDLIDRNINEIRMKINKFRSLKSSKAAIKTLEDIKRDYIHFIEFAEQWKKDINSKIRLIQTKFYGGKN